MWVIIWTTITVVSILTNNAEGQVGSQSSNLPHSDSSDKKGEEILASNSFEVSFQFNFFSTRLLGIFDYFGGKSVEVTGNLRKLFLTSFGRAKRSSRKLVSYFGPSKFSQLLLISLFSSMMKALKEEPLVCHSPPQLIHTTLVDESILTMI